MGRRRGTSAAAGCSTAAFRTERPSMSVLDKIAAAVTPPESAEARAEANAKAWAAAEPGDFLTAALEHHKLLLSAFAAAKAASDDTSRTAAQKHLGVVLV